MRKLRRAVLRQEIKMVENSTTIAAFSNVHLSLSNAKNALAPINCVKMNYFLSKSAIKDTALFRKNRRQEAVTAIIIQPVNQ
jgi:hypothetical protein